MAEGVLFGIADGVKSELVSLAADEFALWWGFKKELGKLDGTVSRIKAVLIDAEKRARIERTEQLKNWIGVLREAVLDAEDLLDDFSTEVRRKSLVARCRLCEEVRIFFSASNQIWYGLRMAHKVRSLRERLDEIKNDSDQYNFKFQPEENAPLTMVREQTTSYEPEIVIGRDDDRKKIVSFLLNSKYDENVTVISIVGIGGLGKTTLAQHVFNDELVKVHFGEKIWVSVSGGFDVIKILKKATSYKGDRERLDSLRRKLAQKIKNNKYLLVIDDVWDGKDGKDESEKWDRLKELLPRDVKGSKVVVTTRSHMVAKFTSTIAPHVLPGLSVDASWDLFRRYAFQGRESGRIDEQVRKEIVERCCGVPLVIKAIARRLMCLEHRAQLPPFIINELPVRVHDDNIIQTLKLSYDILPSYMKRCFAYCSLFPKGALIPVKSLIQLWIAQGFISFAKSDECLEDAGRRCFEDLLFRSFFNRHDNRGWGKIEYCTMHDFMHDLAAEVAGSESTCMDLGGKKISQLTRHASCNFELDLSQQNSIPLRRAEYLRTLMLLRGKWKEGVWESICREFGRLRALVLYKLEIKEVSPFIEKFKHLRYLDLSWNDMEILPNSIINLVNLQMLKLNGCKKLKELPREINKLVNLRHLDLGCSFDWDLCRSLEHMPYGIGQLTSLQTLSCFVVAKRSSESKDIGGLDDLIRLNELRGRLEIIVQGYEKISTELLGKKQHLEALTLRWDLAVGDSEWNIDLYDEMLHSLQPHSYLRELSVEGYGGISFPSWLSELTELAELRLKGFPHLQCIDSEGVGEREMSMFFPALKRLEIDDCPSLEGWWKKTDDDDDESTTSRTLTEEVYFPMLSSLHITNCRNLTTMPLFPSLDDELSLLKSSSMPFQQTMKMTTWKAPSSVSSSSGIRPLSKLKNLELREINDLESLPEDGLQNLASLQQLVIQKCSKLKALHLPHQGMHSLQRLVIYFCPELGSLSGSQSQGIPNLPSLQRLHISDCSEELGGRLSEGKEAVEYWPYIKHVPNILIDTYYIQKDGRYVKAEEINAPIGFRIMRMAQL